MCRSDIGEITVLFGFIIDFSYNRRTYITGQDQYFGRILFNVVGLFTLRPCISFLISANSVSGKENFSLIVIDSLILPTLGCIRDSRFEIRDSRFEIRDSRFEIRDSRFEIRDSRFEIRKSNR